MDETRWILIDFDHAFLHTDVLNEWAAVSLKRDPERNARLAALEALRQPAPDAGTYFREALRLIGAERSHLPALIRRLKKAVSPSVSRNREFFKRYRGRIYLFSTSFRELIEPIAQAFFIDPAFVLANTLQFDEHGRALGADPDHPLLHPGGKAALVSRLGLRGEVIALGGPAFEAAMQQSGVEHTFYAFGEQVLRSDLQGTAPERMVPSFDEFLYVNQLPMAISYPKNRIRVLLLENIHPKGLELFAAEGYQVETLPRALSEAELCERIKGVSILGIRSKTQITPAVLANANRLLAVGTFSIGTNQIDLDACTQQGVIAFNAPYSNTRSVVELVIGEMILLMRRIPYVNAQMHQGVWVKSAKHSREVRGKKLGIIGYGNIGSQLSVIAEALGMQVIYYDLVERLALGNAVKAPALRDLLRKSDVVTLHVDGRQDNANLFGEKEFRMMKPGAIFLNLSRGHVVDIAALYRSLKSGHLGGAAIDVFPYEPASNDEPFVSELQRLDNVILTSHIGGSTEEAQQNIAEYVPARVIEYINTGSTFGSVNFPNLQLPAQHKVHRLIHIHRNVPGILAQINQVLARHRINIEGQYLKTSDQIGYAITDINTAYRPEVLEDLKGIEHTIKFRVLY
ncbi:MAG: phosphoglycerate dehydrogenase [Bacteroidia bacterium]|nr:phosphoglycerate dehydrogenase [Bacteroidia bacterium]